MARGTNERTEPHFNIGTIGHAEHGKATLAAAIARVQSDRGRIGGRVVDISDAAIQTARVDYKPKDRRFTQSDYKVTAGEAQIDGAVLVVSAAEGPMPETLEHLQLARQMNIPLLAVFLNKVDLVRDKEMVEIVEMEMRELLSEFGYSGDDIPFVAGSALNALDSGDDACIVDLVFAVDEYIFEQDIAR